MIFLSSAFVNLFSQSMVAVWLAGVVIFLVVEAMVPGLVSIWFALGALFALISALFHAQLWLQLVWFFVVSIAALAFTRPLAKKYINGRVQPTNADMIIGADCIVTEKIDNLRGTGAVSAAGKVWTARSLQPDCAIDAGEVVEAVRIEGVKLIVKTK